MPSLSQVDSAFARIFGDNSDDLMDQYDRSEQAYYRELQEHEEAFSPFLDVLEGVDAENFRWAVNSANRVKHVIDTIKDLDLVKVTITPNHIPPSDNYGLGQSGWKIEVIHTGGIFAYVLPGVRADESVITYPC